MERALQQHTCATAQAASAGMESLRCFDGFKFCAYISRWDGTRDEIFPAPAGRNRKCRATDSRFGQERIPADAQEIGAAHKAGFLFGGCDCSRPGSRV